MLLIIKFSIEDKKHRAQSHEDYFLIAAQTLINYVILFKTNLKSNLSHFLDCMPVLYWKLALLSILSQILLQHI